MKKQSNQPLIYTAAGALIIGSLLLGYKYLSPQKTDINVVTTYTDIPSVTVGNAQYSYGYGGGYNGNSTIKMDGYTQQGYFFPWGWKGAAPSWFNPSKGMVATTADGKYRGNSEPKLYTENPTPYIVVPMPSSTPYPSWNPDATFTPTTPTSPAPTTTLTPGSKTFSPSDLNKDGKVNIVDYNIFIANYKK